MGLFQKKIVPIVTPRYQLGHQDTLLVVGLGNAGTEYEKTRHNAGFMCMDEFAEKEGFNPWIEKKDLKSLLCAKIIDGRKVILCKPTTMMNLSGDAVQAVRQFYKIDDSKTCIVYDELDIAFGTVRTQGDGGSAGHNGVKSLLEHSKSAFWRVRVGIGPKQPEQMDTADFVLQNFNKDQLEKLPNIKKEVNSVIDEWLSGNAKPDTRKISG